MLFNSFAYALFLPVVYVLYWAAQGRLRAQNLILLFAAWVFYGWWDPRFLVLLVGNAVVDWAMALAMASTGRRRTWLALSLLANLGVLGFFKYFGFFVDSAAVLLEAVGLQVHLPTLRVVLPVGISFYTFQSLSYTLDVYRGTMSPTRDLLGFLTFHSFFPQLVAGPIERAADLLPQCLAPRSWDGSAAVDGCRQILWGLVKKVVVADRLAPFVDQAFSGHESLSAPVLWAGAVAFAIQIYGDFSGYSDVALGTARLFGFRLTRNFATPYFARDIAEFWRRWHVTLSTWFRDYVYIPLGGNRGGAGRAVRNVLITFGLSGLWHGANWTFVAWGLLNGLYYLPILLGGTQRRHEAMVAAGRWLPAGRDAVRMGTTFVLTLVAWVFFRSASLTDALRYLSRMATAWSIEGVGAVGLPLALCAALLVAEWTMRERAHGLDIGHLPRWARRAVVYATIALLAAAGSTGSVPFIYFQF